MITIDSISKYGADEDSGSKITITSVQKQSYQTAKDQEEEWELSGISPSLKKNVSPLIDRLNNLPKDILSELLGNDSGLAKVLSLAEVQASLVGVTNDKLKLADISDLRGYLNQLQRFKSSVKSDSSVALFLSQQINQVDDKFEAVLVQKEKEQKEAQEIEKQKKEQEERDLEAQKKAQEEEQSKTAQSYFAPNSDKTKLNNNNVAIPSTNYSSGNTYVWGNCTWGVKSYFGTRVGDYWGNGQEWADNARSAGFTVDDNPVSWNTVAVFRGGLYGSSSEYGHVAIVADVKGDQVEVYEMNVTQLGAYSYRWLPKEGLQFIHV